MAGPLSRTMSLGMLLMTAVAACARSDHAERPAGWNWFGIAIRGAEFAGTSSEPGHSRLGRSRLFSHHKVLYRFDVERRRFHADRPLPSRCTPAAVDADNIAWCAVDAGLAAVPPTGPIRVHPLVGMTPEQHLVARGNTIWFAVPGRHAYGRFERSRYRVFRLPASVDTRQVAVGGNAVWVADRRHVARVSQSRVLMRLELPGASASATITAIAARGDGTLFALVADTQWSVVEFSPTGLSEPISVAFCRPAGSSWTGAAVHGQQS